MLSNSIMERADHAAAMSLTASPAAIAFDGSATAVVTAKLTDAAGQAVPDGTPVSFEVVEHGSANPASTTTTAGSASSTITPAMSAGDSITVVVTSGSVASSISVGRAELGDLFIRSPWRVLGVLLEPPFVAHRQKDVARELRLPEASVQRGLRILVGADLVRRTRGQYVVNVAQDAVRYIWLLRQVERELYLPPELRNALTLLLTRPEFQDALVVVFGSWARRGLAVALESDIDIAVFTDALAPGTERSFAGNLRLDIQVLPREEARTPTTSVALDALLNGIPVRGREEMFASLVQLESFPKAFLLQRLDQAASFIDRAHIFRTGEQQAAAEYFEDLADHTVGQVRNILEHGRTMSWRETRREPSADAAITQLRTRLAREGDRIWLT